jgi:hypothetical protein
VNSRADAARVAAIRNGLDHSDGLAPVFFGERARLEVAASAGRLLAAVRSADIIQAGDQLRQAVDLIDRQDPSRLRPRGLARLIVGRRRRLAQVRARFEAAAGALERVALDLDGRSRRLALQVEHLDRLHAQARGVILELDAYREAGEALATRFADPDRAVDAAWDRFPVRLETLDAARRSAVELLSLVRAIQNVDSALGAALAGGAAAIRGWNAEWADRLGLGSTVRGRRMRPDPVGLYESKARTLDRLTPPIIVVAEARKRRQSTEREMETRVKALAAPRVYRQGQVGDGRSGA